MSANPHHTPARVPSIFISYRHDDSMSDVVPLISKLQHHFGERLQIFMDLKSIPYGEDFVEVINAGLGSCLAMIVVMGRQWVSITDLKTTGRRLDKPDDIVRMEITRALERKVHVIPVLVGGARMPEPDELPTDLLPLARLNTLEIERGRRWEDDVEKLIQRLEHLLAENKNRSGPRSRRQLAVLAVLACSALLAAGLLLAPRSCGPAVGSNTGTHTPLGRGSEQQQTTLATQPCPTPAPGVLQGDWDRIVTNARLSVVQVFRGPEVEEITSTGFVVSGVGHILTMDYIVKFPGSLSIRTEDGVRHPAVRVDVHEGIGLAILKIDDSGLPALKLYDCVPDSDLQVMYIRTLPQGSRITAVGRTTRVPEKEECNPRFINFDSQHKGPRIISPEMCFMSVTFGEALQGNGGGPVLNAAGEVVGVSYRFEPPSDRFYIRSDIARGYLAFMRVKL